MTQRPYADPNETLWDYLALSEGERIARDTMRFSGQRACEETMRQTLRLGWFTQQKRMLLSMYPSDPVCLDEDTAPASSPLSPYEGFLMMLAAFAVFIPRTDFGNLAAASPWLVELGQRLLQLTSEERWERAGWYLTDRAMDTLPWEFRIHTLRTLYPAREHLRGYQPAVLRLRDQLDALTLGTSTETLLRGLL